MVEAWRDLQGQVSTERRYYLSSRLADAATLGPVVRGHWGIPVPPVAAGEVRPELIIVPLLGWDMDRFRLGFGAGYFDRTLAALHPRPFCIGTGLQAAHLPTIAPQPHDVPMDAIVTELGLQAGTIPEGGALPSARKTD